MTERILLSLFTLGSVIPFLQTDPLKESITRGQSVYETTCKACHMINGEGLDGSFPPLANTGRLSDKARLVKILTNGLNEAIMVNGQEYTMGMEAMNLSDKEMADVLNYIRNSWGNKAPIIQVSEIKSLKK
jgi:mono/diheme cytochrome c family protein